MSPAYSLCFALSILLCSCGPWSGYEEVADGFGYDLDVDLDGGPEGDDAKYMVMDAWLCNSQDSILAPTGGFSLEVLMRPTTDPYDLVHPLKHISVGDSGSFQWEYAHFKKNPFFKNLRVEGMAADSLVRLRFRMREVLNAEGYAEKERQDKRQNQSAAVDAFKMYVQLYRPDVENVPLEPFVIKETFVSEGQSPRYGDSVLVKYLLLDFSGKPLDGIWGTEAPVWLRMGGGSFPLGFYEGLKGMRTGETAMVVVPYTFAWGEEGNPDLYIPPMENVVYKLELFEVKGGN